MPILSLAVRPAWRLPRLSLPTLRPEALTLLTSLFFLLLCNGPFWRHLYTVAPPEHAAQWAAWAVAFVVLLLVFNLLLTLFAWRWVLRPVVSLLLLLTAVVAYFMNQYGVMIDAGMVQNALQTDAGETRDLLSGKLLAYLLLLGVLPGWLAWRVPLAWRPWPREVLSKLVIASGSLCLIVACALLHYPTFATVVRNHRELRLLLAPTNYIQATHRYVRGQFKRPRQLLAIGTDARLSAAWAGHARKSLTVIVVGETARADHFGLNGYSRDTTPQLARVAGLISFGNFWSCGTETAVSVPCMFSDLGRERHGSESAGARESLLDVLQRAGLAVSWRDNQSGCKGVCDRVPQEARVADARWCRDGACLDEALLVGLDERLARLDRDSVLVLHMMGSHGPAYAKRYPSRLGLFQPACATSQLDRCSQQDIINAYDNSLRYTDEVLAKLIATLARHDDRVDAAMFYLSDHGESLGEHNLYLHGTPYLFAPDGQKHVPALAWLSDGYQREFGVDAACLRARRNRPYSHDNLFHSMLGLLGVSTRAYDARLDLFAACRR
ncbi:MAG TPA: phosphoethanolamine--lipid A transferase [Chitinolyticbacter sp.]|nr:phosphoethanolamine--lipid A transferase [Chitinolyticbacter sp.]